MFYLKFKKPIIIFLALAATIIIGLDNWLKSKDRTIDTSWKITAIDSGSSLIVTRHDETKNVNLCGVAPIGNVTKKYLTSNWLRVSRRIETKYLSIGSKSSIREGQNLILTSFFSIFYLFPFSRQDKSRLLETKTQTAYINRKLILTEVPKIDHCVGQTFQGIMQLTNSFKTEQ